MAPHQKRVLIALGALTATLVIYGPAFLRWMDLQARKEQLRAEVAYLQQENRRLFQEMKRLREDPAYAEAVARRDFGFVRPGETVVKFQRFRTETSNNTP